MTNFAEFDHEHYVLDKHTGVLSRKVGHVAPKTAEEGNAESRSVLEALAIHVEVAIKSRNSFPNGIFIGGDDCPRPRGALDP